MNQDSFDKGLKTRREVLGASSLLAGRTEVVAGDYHALLDRSRPIDLMGSAAAVRRGRMSAPGRHKTL